MVKVYDFNDFGTNIIDEPAKNEKVLYVKRKPLYPSEKGKDVYFIPRRELLRIVDYLSCGGFADVVSFIPFGDAFGVSKDVMLDEIAEFFSKKMSEGYKRSVIGTEIALDTKDDFLFYFRECGYYDNDDISKAAISFFEERYIYSSGVMKRKLYTKFYDEVQTK